MTEDDRPQKLEARRRAILDTMTANTAAIEQTHRRISRTGEAYDARLMTERDVLWAWSEGGIPTGQAARMLSVEPSRVTDAAAGNDVPPPDWMILDLAFHASAWDEPAEAVAAFRAGIVPFLEEDASPEERRQADIRRKAILGSMERRRRTVDPARAFAEGFIDRDEALSRSGLTLPQLIAVLADEELPIPGEGELAFYHDDADRDFAEAVARAARQDWRGPASGRGASLEEPKTVYDLLASWGAGVRTGVEVCRRLDITPEELKATAEAARMPAPISRGTAPTTYRNPEPPVSEPTPRPERRPTGLPRGRPTSDRGGFKP